MKKVLGRFSMNEANTVSTSLAIHFKLSNKQSPTTKEEWDHMANVSYASTIGSLMYDMVCTRSNIAHVVRVVSRYMSNSGKQHWEAVKRILRHLRGATSLALYFKQSDLGLRGYVDVDMAEDVDGRKSTTVYVYTLGGTTISWVSKLQKIVSLSIIEVKYVAITEASKEMIWLQSFLEEL